MISNKDNEIRLNLIRRAQETIQSSAKLYIHVRLDEWHQNCAGFLILYKHNDSFYFAIVEALTLKIMFDMELYSNFTKHARFLGEQKVVVFLTPCAANYIKTIFALESKQELMELKLALQTIYNVPDEKEEQLSFFKQPHVRELLSKADINFKMIEKDLLLREQIEDQIKRYQRKAESVFEKKKNTGFKIYGLGREQWKLQQEQKQYLKQKEQAITVENLIQLNKQARLRGIKQ